MYIEQALVGNNRWWRVLLTTLATAGIFIINFITYLLMPKEAVDASYDVMKSWPSSIALLVNLIPFVILLALLFTMVYTLHQRNILSLTTTRKQVDFKRIGFSLALVMGLNLASFAFSYACDSSTISWNFHPIPFLVLCLISIMLFPFQIGFEEFLFRGYLMQQIGILAKNKWVPLLITSVVFGVFHSANPEVAKMGFGVMFFYIGTGFLLGIMTLMDDGLELALGFHLGNNLIAALLVTSDFSALHTDALFKLSGKVPPSESLQEMVISMVVLYPIILLTFAKKYQWHHWKSKLFGTLNKTTRINHD
ncbi:CPBP family intramembrane glutamic endopeptidase [Flavobacterium aciduliphilum]|uniref:CAAX prenyl protease 2/Lysostaphin resistance protein A-like domain-containing protein n=1 Tax=Flavobacterium aciduliphilum TaxID=1101402 RepID=A0A328YAD7_9FLAO|nr:CPBP family intramembrane glutamic endopeptidase [Flavobacterium aciduliphilum]RAR70143.1 hypothetical protein CLV55_11255 [Flavobacterium aciduliphilum]